MQITIGQEYVNFIEGLEKPMKLNEMRNMKEPNYTKLRDILKNTAMYGDPFLRGLAEFADEIGLSRNSYNMIYEGFWDLYCRKPAPVDLTAKKLEGWVNFINLSLPAFEYTTASAAEGAEDDKPMTQVDDVKAVARIRIPFKRPEKLEEEEVDAGDEEEAKASEHQS